MLKLNASYAALAGSRSVNHQQEVLAKNLAALASARRIASAADDPAGLVISEQLRAEIEGLDRASSNLEAGINLTQIADGALEQTQALVLKQRDLALQAGNSATLSDEARAALDQQYQALGKAIDQIGQNTSFAAKNLLDGSFRNQAIQAGAQGGQTINLDIASTASGSERGFDQDGLGLSGVSLATPEGAADALTRVDHALADIGRQRGALGAIQANALASTRSSLAITQINLTGSASVIADTDYAKASANAAASQIRLQSSLAMLSQGNLSSRSVLRLLGQ